jgi:hypothetical protein
MASECGVAGANAIIMRLPLYLYLTVTASEYAHLSHSKKRRSWSGFSVGSTSVRNIGNPHIAHGRRHTLRLRWIMNMRLRHRTLPLRGSGGGAQYFTTQRQLTLRSLRREPVGTSKKSPAKCYRRKYMELCPFDKLAPYVCLNFRVNKVEENRNETGSDKFSKWRLGASIRSQKCRKMLRPCWVALAPP